MCKIVFKEVSDVYFEEDPTDDFMQSNVNLLYTPTPAVMTTIFHPYLEETDVQVLQQHNFHVQGPAAVAPAASVLVPGANIPPSEAGTTTQSQPSDNTNIAISQQIVSAVAAVESALVSSGLFPSSAENIVSLYEVMALIASHAANGSVPSAPVPSEAGSGTQSQTGSGVPSAVTAAQLPFNLPPVSDLISVIQQMSTSQLSEAGSSAQSQEDLYHHSVLNNIEQFLIDADAFLLQPPFSLPSVPSQEGASVESQAGNSSQTGPGVQTATNSVQPQAGSSVQSLTNILSQFPFEVIQSISSVAAQSQADNVAQLLAASIQVILQLQSALSQSTTVHQSDMGISMQFQAEPAAPLSGSPDSSAASEQSQGSIGVQLPHLPPPVPQNILISQFLHPDNGAAEPAAPLSGSPDSSAASVQSQGNIGDQLPHLPPPVPQNNLISQFLSGSPDLSAASVQSQGSTGVHLPHLLPPIPAATVPQTETSSGAQQTSGINNLVSQFLSPLSSSAQLGAEPTATSQGSPEEFHTTVLPQEVWIPDFYAQLSGLMHQFHQLT